MVSGSLKAANVQNINAADIRSGKSLAGVAGTLKLGLCRNGVSNTVFNFTETPMPTNAAGNANGGSDPYHWWDSVINLHFPTAFSGTDAAWSDTYFCDGSQMVDVTNTDATFLTPSGTPNCAGQCTDAVPFSKIAYEPYTELYITNSLIPSGACGAASECATWPETIEMCKNLNSGDGTNKWRLPTDVEASLLYAAGIYISPVSLNSPPAWLLEALATSTTDAAAVTNARRFNVGFGALVNIAKTSYWGVICVRNKP